MIHAPARLVLLGHPIHHSLSPRMQGAALTAAGISLRYDAIDVAPSELAATLTALAAERAAGNVTVPHKEAAHDACGRLTALAARVGAINTFWTEDGVIVGDNTDVGGFDHTVRALLGRDPEGLTIGVLGAGGAAAAVLAAVEGWPACNALVANRSVARAERLCARFGSVAHPNDAAEIARRADLVVNATSIGLHDDDMPMDPRTLRDGAFVLDLVYRRGETAFVRAVREAGHTAVDGLPMLVEQGALAFERWFGVAPDRAAMLEAVR